MNVPPTSPTGFLLKTIQACPDLQWATPEQQLQLAARGHHRSLKAGEILFQKGERGESIFLIIQGDLEVYLPSTADLSELIMARLFNQGEALGEWAATREGQTRSASVRARGNSTLLEISYDLIREVGALTGFLGHSASRGQKLESHDTLATASPLFNLMTRQGSARLSYLENNYSGEAEIFSEGDVSEEVFLILEGTVEIYSADEAVRTILGKGQIFGELGVSQSVPRSTSAKAKTPCRLLVLKAQDFLALTRDNNEFAQHLLTLRKIYQTRSSEVVLQFHYQVGEQPRFSSTIQLDGDRKLISDYSIYDDSVSVETLPETGDAIVFSYQDESRDISRRLELHEGRISGARFHGPHPEAGRVVEAIRNDLTISADQIQQFESQGTLFDPGISQDLLCHCMQITRSEIAPGGEVAQCSLEELMQVTGAGTVCGSCRGELASLCQSSESLEMNLLEVSEFQPDIFRVRMTPKNQEPLASFTPGQHIQLEATIRGEKVRRTYTLTSPAGETRWREITFKRDPHGLFSRWLAKAKPGNEVLSVSAPTGEFTANLDQSEPIILLVAGIGVTPALNILRSRVQKGSGPRVIVDHSFHSVATGPCREELLLLTESNPDLEYHPRETIAGQRIQSRDVERYHSLYPAARWLICGPEGFETVMQEKLESAGVFAGNVAVELFHARGSLQQDSLPKDRASLVLGLLTTVFTASVLGMDLLPQSWRDWQSSFAGHWISGSALMVFLGWQWVLPLKRIGRSTGNSAKSLQLHRRLGALSPLLLLLHGSGFGAGMLGLISLLFLTHTVLGVADRSLISDTTRQRQYLQVWLYPHIVISLLLSALALFHLWLILGHGGPS